MSDTNGTVLSKAAMIRKILSHKGSDKLTAPEVMAKVKEKFGVEVGAPSVYQEWRRAGQSVEPVVATTAVKPAAPVTKPGVREPLSALETVMLVKEAVSAAGGVDKLEEALKVVKEAAAKAGGLEALETGLEAYKKIVG